MDIKLFNKMMKKYNLGCNYLDAAACIACTLPRSINNCGDIIISIFCVANFVKAYNKYLETLENEKHIKFHPSNEKEFQAAKEYIEALNAFVMARPFNAKNTKYGFDDDLICIDIRDSSEARKKFHINFNGKADKPDSDDSIYYLIITNIKGSVSDTSISFDLKDVQRVFELTYNNFEELDIYLSKLK